MPQRSTASGPPGFESLAEAPGRLRVRIVRGQRVESAPRVVEAAAAVVDEGEEVLEGLTGIQAAGEVEGLRRGRVLRVEQEELPELELGLRVVRVEARALDVVMLRGLEEAAIVVSLQPSHACSHQTQCR